MRDAVHALPGESIVVYFRSNGLPAILIDSVTVDASKTRTNCSSAVCGASSMINCYREYRGYKVHFLLS
jgi:hypothetical protein